MKKVVLSVIFFMMAMLAACTKYQINEEQSDNNNPFPDYVYNQEKEHRWKRLWSRQRCMDIP